VCPAGTADSESISVDCSIGRASPSAAFARPLPGSIRRRLWMFGLRRSPSMSSVLRQARARLAASCVAASLVVAFAVLRPRAAQVVVHEHVAAEEAA